MMRARSHRAWGPCAATALLVGCSTCTNTDPMQAQAKLKAYAAEDFFADGRAMRMPVAGTVPVERGLPEQRVPAGGDFDGGFRPDNPLELTSALVADGHHHFDIYCATCHGLLADGESEVARKMALREPPALVGLGHPEGHSPVAPPGSPLPHPAGFYFAVMTDGYGLMPSYAPALSPRERWAVEAYLQVLWRSQSTPLALAPREVRERLLRESP